MSKISISNCAASECRTVYIQHGCDEQLSGIHPVAQKIEMTDVYESWSCMACICINACVNEKI